MCNYTLCPHSAIGVFAVEKIKQIPQAEMNSPHHKPEGVHTPIFISLATAHPAKFPVAIESAIGSSSPLPQPLAELLDKPTRCLQLASSSADELKALIDKITTGNANLLQQENRKSENDDDHHHNAITTSFEIRVPGSCANLGSGFDVLGKKKRKCLFIYLILI